MSNYLIFDNVTHEDLCVKTANYADQSDQWIDGGTNLVREEHLVKHSTFPIMPIVRNGEFTSFHPFTGWFLALGNVVMHNIASKLELKKNQYESNVQRIHLVAHGPGEQGIVVPHKDLDSNYLSIVWQVSSIDWDESWGGSTFIDGQEIKFKKDRAILFPSDTLHYGTPPNPNCPHTRIVLNVIFGIDPSIKSKIFG